MYRQRLAHQASHLLVQKINIFLKNRLFLFTINTKLYGFLVFFHLTLRAFFGKRTRLILFLFPGFKPRMLRRHRWFGVQRSWSSYASTGPAIQAGDRRSPEGLLLPAHEDCRRQDPRSQVPKEMGNARALSPGIPHSLKNGEFNFYKIFIGIEYYSHILRLFL